MLAMDATQSLLSDIEGFLSRTGMSATKFGLSTVNDGKLVHNLRAGKDIRLRTAERIRNFMASFDADREDAA